MVLMFVILVSLWRQDLRVHGAMPGVPAALGAASCTPAREPRDGTHNKKFTEKLE
jgi:hypothetical protein